MGAEPPPALPPAPVQVRGGVASQARSLQQGCAAALLCGFRHHKIEPQPPCAHAIMWYCKNQRVAFIPHSLEMLPLSLMYRELDDGQRRALAGMMLPVDLTPGQELCVHGEPADCFWMLHQGEVQVGTPATHQAATALYSLFSMSGDDQASHLTHRAVPAMADVLLPPLPSPHQSAALR